MAKWKELPVIFSFKDEEKQPDPLVPFWDLYDVVVEEGQKGDAERERWIWDGATGPMMHGGRGTSTPRSFRAIEARKCLRRCTDVLGLSHINVVSYIFKQ